MPHAHANGIELAYDVTGEGEPLLLIMGLGAQLIHWPDGLVQRFAGRGFQVIRFDNRDVGASTHLHDAPAPSLSKAVARWVAGLPVPAPYQIGDLADDAAGLLDALRLGRAHVLGVSLGGMIAQSLALRHPGRLRTLTSVMSTPGDRRYAFARPDVLYELLRRPARTRSEAQDRAVQFARKTAGRFPLDEARTRETAGTAWDRDPHPRGGERQLLAILASGSRTEALRRLHLPTLVLHGSADPLIRPAAGRATADAIPAARFEPIEGMGHELPEAAWDTLVERVARFTRVTAATPARRAG